MNYRRTIPETPVPGKPLGRHVNHDPRSLAYLVPAVGSYRTVLWARKIEVLDQGDLGSCTGNAACGALGTTPLWDALSGSEKASLNESEAVTLYSSATRLDNYSGVYPPTDTGSDGLSVAKACKAAGLISGYLHATSLEAMKTALQTTPVIVGVNWYEGFDTPDAQGRVKISGTVRGGHEFEVIGWDESLREFTAVNSWGPSWGDGGRFRISEADMTRLLSEDGDCTQLLPLNVPAPVPSQGGASFPGSSAAVDAHVASSAARAKLSVAAWLEHHLETYFNLPPQ